MRAEEIQHGAQDRALAQSCAQLFGRQAGQREEAARSVFVAEQPAERGQGQRLRVGGGGG